MIRMFVRHRVADYGAWKGIYDGFDQDRQALGVDAHAVYRSIKDPNDVTVWHDFATQEAAESFMSSAQLREAMETSGVQGTPEVWVTTES